MNCGSVNCAATATRVVHWPGSNPIAMCEPCVARASGAAIALGFDLRSEPIVKERPTRDELRGAVLDCEDALHVCLAALVPDEQQEHAEGRTDIASKACDAARRALRTIEGLRQWPEGGSR